MVFQVMLNKTTGQHIGDSKILTFPSRQYADEFYKHQVYNNVIQQKRLPRCPPPNGSIISSILVFELRNSGFQNNDKYQLEGSHTDTYARTNWWLPETPHIQRFGVHAILAQNLQPISSDSASKVIISPKLVNSERKSSKLIDMVLTPPRLLISIACLTGKTLSS
ncbi:hypothetical protein N7507_009281 [Penicillium longicatenatum]|nr:hypothetical protein N7507_009281 [Penicillium longicatenatum]